ncbi:MAG: hypothetical protein IKE57_00675 [Oscillospiraceae bacterium]|nr:hypothetical protein [Oscillospiraceae bacterium]
MSIYVSLSLFSLVILLYLGIAELFTILFRFTGLPDERARFQVTSLLTGCGFTTRESELLLSSRGRRRLANITMLFGYVFNITVVSAFINIFLSLKRAQVTQYLLTFLVPLALAVFVVIFIRVPAVRSRIDRVLQRLADRFIFRDSCNTALLLDYIGDETIVQITLRQVPEALRDVPLAASGLKNGESILVMLVERPGEKAAPAEADTVFRTGDKLTVFGDYRTICRVFCAGERFSDLKEEK